MEHKCDYCGNLLGRRFIRGRMGLSNDGFSHYNFCNKGHLELFKKKMSYDFSDEPFREETHGPDVCIVDLDEIEYNQKKRQQYLNKEYRCNNCKDPVDYDSKKFYYRVKNTKKNITYSYYCTLSCKDTYESYILNDKEPCDSNGITDKEHSEINQKQKLKTKSD